MATKIAIRGFGKAGRLFIREYETGRFNGCTVCLIADSFVYNNIENAAYLLRYSTTRGRFDGTVQFDSVSHSLIINSRIIQVYPDDEMANVPLGDFGVDYVLDFTGKCTADDVLGCLNAGAKRVISNNIVKGYPVCSIANISSLDPSCNCYCVDADAAVGSTLLSVLNEYAGVNMACLTYTKSSMGALAVEDEYAKTDEFESGRSCFENITISTKSSAKTVGRIIAELNGKVFGTVQRVPSLTGSLVQIVANTQINKTKEEIAAKLKAASETEFKGYLSYEEDYITSVDAMERFSPVYLAKKTGASAGTDSNFVQLYAYYYPEEIACSVTWLVLQNIVS